MYELLPYKCESIDFACAVNVINCPVRGQVLEIDVIYPVQSGNQHWPQQGGHICFHENVKIICLKETEVTSRLSTIKRLKFNWVRWIVMVDIEGRCPDEMDSMQWQNFTQSAQEGIQVLPQLLPWWIWEVYLGQVVPENHSTLVQLWSDTVH